MRCKNALKSVELTTTSVGLGRLASYILRLRPVVGSPRCTYVKNRGKRYRDLILLELGECTFGQNKTCGPFFKILARVSLMRKIFRGANKSASRMNVKFMDGLGLCRHDGLGEECKNRTAVIRTPESRLQADHLVQA